MVQICNTPVLDQQVEGNAHDARKEQAQNEILELPTVDAVTHAVLFHQQRHGNEIISHDVDGVRRVQRAEEILRGVFDVAGEDLMRDGCDRKCQERKNRERIVFQAHAPLLERKHHGKEEERRHDERGGNIREVEVKPLDQGALEQIKPADAVHPPRNAERKQKIEDAHLAPHAREQHIECKVQLCGGDNDVEPRKDVGGVHRFTTI